MPELREDLARFGARELDHGVRGEEVDDAHVDGPRPEPLRLPSRGRNRLDAGPAGGGREKEKAGGLPGDPEAPPALELERETGFEPATLSLGS